MAALARSIAKSVAGAADFTSSCYGLSAVRSTNFAIRRRVASVCYAARYRGRKAAVAIEDPSPASLQS